MVRRNLHRIVGAGLIPDAVRLGSVRVLGRRARALHYVEAGDSDGPLVVLLHGFPEFWFGWRLQIEPLAAAGFRVVAPDTRGYNLSSKPEGFRPSRRPARRRHPRPDRRTRCRVGAVGRSRLGRKHRLDDAMNHPEVVDRLAILNAAHPRRLSQGLHHPNQLRKSWYFFFFAVPGLPEEVVHLETGTSSGTSWKTRARRTPTRKSNATSRRGRSPGQRPG